jgi:type IV secretion system protein VirD4
MTDRSEQRQDSSVPHDEHSLKQYSEIPKGPSLTSNTTILGLSLIISGLVLFLVMLMQDDAPSFFAGIALLGLFVLAPVGVVVTAVGLFRSTATKRSKYIEEAKAYNRAGRTIFNGKIIPFGKVVKTKDDDGKPIPYPYMVRGEKQPKKFINPLPFYTFFLAVYLALAYYCIIYENIYSVAVVFVGIPVVLTLYYFFAIRPFKETRGMKEAELRLSRSQQAFYADIGKVIQSIQGGTVTDAANAALLCTFEQRKELIDKIFQERSWDIHVRLHVKLKRAPFRFSFHVVRGLRLMPPLDREMLRAVLHLYNAGHISSGGYEYYAGALLAGNKQASIEWYDEKIKNNDIYEKYMPLSQLLTIESRAFWLLENELCWRYEEVLSDVLRLLDQKMMDFPEDETIKRVYDMVHHGGRWLAKSDIPDSNYENIDNTKYVLRLGTLEDGTPLTFSQDGSLMTIGGPGTGKTQCLVVPNLLTWEGPAIVLDVKPELWDMTAGFRQKTFGRVYSLDFTSDQGQKFNPFDYIRSDPNEIFADSQFFANLIVPPSSGQGGNQKFWESSARDILQALLIYLVTEHSEALARGEKRDATKVSLTELIRVIVDREILGDALEYLSNHPMELSRLLGQQIRSNLIEPEKTGSNVLSSVLNQLWTDMQPLLSNRATDIAAGCDWSPDGLRQENATLYIKMKPGQVMEYAPLLRLILGVHLREYLALSDEESKQRPPILLLFDEMAQLGYMKAIEQAVDLGRSKGIKLWGFIQRLGHLRDHYSEAEGLLGNMKVQTYLSPPTEDGTAQMVSDRLGTRQDLATGQQIPLADPSALTGAEYSDKIVITGQGEYPAKVSRDWAYKNSEFQTRMSAPAPK